jgi:hypothetical protein
VTQSADAAEIAALRDKAPDCKESMEIGRDWDSTWKNKWPQETDAPKFKETMLDFFQVRVFLILCSIYINLLVVNRPVTNFTLLLCSRSHLALV